jgi:hypothetical protein
MDTVSIGCYEGPTHTVIEALIAARFDGAMLELAGDTSEGFEALMESVSAAHPDLADANRRATEAFRIGPIPFRVGFHLLPIEGRNLARLAETRVDGETFIVELAVRDDEGVLLHAHDVSDGEISVADRVPKEAVARMRAVLGDGLRAPARDPD